MLDFIRLIVLDISQSLGITYKCYMFLFPAIFVLRNFEIYIYFLNNGNIVADIEIPVNETFSIQTTLDIPDVYPYNYYIRFGQDFDDI